MIGYLMNFDEHASRPKYMQLYERLKQDIIEEKFSTGEKLPSVRAVCASLGISKATVENAYNQLTLEGFVESRPKSGYFVVDFKIKEMDLEIQERHTVEKSNEEASKNTADRADENAFNFLEWKRSLNRVLEYKTKSLLSAGDLQGEDVLRYEIAKFIHQSRGVKCQPDQIIVGAGIQVLFGLIAAFLRNETNCIGFEYPGFSKGMYIFEDHGYETLKIPIESDGISMDSLNKSDTKIVYVSPSHQYPTGSVMPIKKRIQLLDWAERVGGYIIEDDYDSILRYEGYPVPALQGISNGESVIYAGSFSKLLIPSLRISFIILPEKLMPSFQKIKTRYSQSVSKIEQLALAEYMSDGSFERHLRRIRKIYGRKNQVLLAAFEKFPSENFKLIGKESGIHVVLSFSKDISIRKMVQLAHVEGIVLEGVEEFRENQILVFSYSGIPDDQIEKVVEKIVAISEHVKKEQD